MIVKLEVQLYYKHYENTLRDEIQEMSISCTRVCPVI